jgi:broad-specificity NMP kinase
MILDEDSVDYGELRSRLAGLLGGGACAVIETVYPGFWLRGLEGLVALVILLRVNPIALCARLSARPWAKGKVLENCLAEALDVVAEEVLPYSRVVVEVDATGLGEEEVLGQAISKASEGRFGVHISWLERDEELANVVSYWSTLLDLYNYGLGERN